MKHLYAYFSTFWHCHWRRNTTKSVPQRHSCAIIHRPCCRMLVEKSILHIHHRLCEWRDRTSLSKDNTVLHHCPGKMSTTNKGQADLSSSQTSVTKMLIRGLLRSIKFDNGTSSKTNHSFPMPGDQWLLQLLLLLSNSSHLLAMLSEQSWNPPCLPATTLIPTYNDISIGD